MWYFVFANWNMITEMLDVGTGICPVLTDIQIIHKKKGKNNDYKEMQRKNNNGWQRLLFIEFKWFRCKGQSNITKL